MAMLILIGGAVECGTASHVPTKIPRHDRGSLDSNKNSRTSKGEGSGVRGAIMVPSRIYALGGMCNTLLHTAVVESYVLGQKEWRSEPCMPRVRAGSAAVSLGGKLWVMGGHDNRCGGGAST
jgi:hypothetical protein